jgi:hypothetical protein
MQSLDTVSFFGLPNVLFIILIIVSYVTLHYSRGVKRLEEIQILFISLFFIVALNLNLYSDPYHLEGGMTDISRLLFIIFLISTIVESSLFQSKTKKKEISVIFLFCFIIGFIVAFLSYPIYTHFETFNLFFSFLILPEVKVPFFYVLVPLQAITSGLIGYFLMSLFDFVSSYIREKPQQAINLKESVFLHFQIVPLTLFPLLIAQEFNKPVLFDPIVTLLYFLCVTQIQGLIYCSILAYLGERIYKFKFGLITSIFTLLSVISSLNVAFLFIIAHVEVGTYLLVIVTTSLIALTFGIIMSRMSHKFS